MISSDPTNRYIAISRYISIGFVSPYVPHSFIIYIHNYSLNGVIDRVPSASYDMSELAGNFYNKSVAYTGLSGISSDGKWLLTTYAVCYSFFGTVTRQKQVILKVADDHSSLIPSVTTDTLPTGFSSLFAEECAFSHLL